MRTLGLLAEEAPGERRVALVPADIPPLIKLGFEIRVQAGAGGPAGHADSAYVDKGATIVADRSALLSQAAILCKVRALGAEPDGGEADLKATRSGQILIASCSPLDRPERIQAAAQGGLTVFALELVPRISRAQSMDVLSSMATLAGFRSVVLAASRLPRIFPMMMTAAGTIPASRVFVLGAGVAGLQAMATAKRLGAIVEGYDIRPVVKEQVQSVGATFVELPLEAADAEDKGGYAKEQGEEFLARQRALLTEVVARSEVVITTANIPGRPAPTLVTQEMVEAMRPGSIIVDLAAERGGNCVLTKADEEVEHSGVLILGPTDLAATVHQDASRMLSRNLRSFLKLLYGGDAEQAEPAFDDEVVAGTMACHGGAVTHERLAGLLGVEVPSAAPEPAPDSSPETREEEA